MYTFQMADAFPIVSQAKSLVQLIFRDSEGAKRTQENFSRQCPFISQARSAVEAISGDTDAAFATQIECLHWASNFVDAVPVAGHIKGVVHYACGDREGRDNAIKSASRTSGAMVGGVGGFLVAGPPGAFAGGIAGAATMDGVTSGIDSAVHGEFRPAGLVQQGANIVENPTDAETWFDTGFMVVGDGLAGLAGGEVVVKGKNFINQRNIREQFEAKRQPLIEKVGEQGAKDLVKAADHMKNVRQIYEIPENKPHLTSVVLEEHNKAYEGHNHQIRKFCQRPGIEPEAMSDYSRPSLTNLEKKVPNAEPPLNRPARTCAEHRACHKLYKDQLAAVPGKTRVATVRYDKIAKVIKAVERCDNCKAYGEVMGEVPGDVANGIEVPNHPGIGKYACYKECAKAVLCVIGVAIIQEHHGKRELYSISEESDNEERDQESKYEDSEQKCEIKDGDQDTDSEDGDQDSNDEGGNRERVYEDGDQKYEYKYGDQESDYKDGDREYEGSDQEHDDEDDDQEYEYEDCDHENDEDGDPENDYENGDREYEFEDGDQESDDEDGDRECDRENGNQDTDSEDGDQDSNDEGGNRESDYEDGYKEYDSEYGDQESDYDDTDCEIV